MTHERRWGISELGTPRQTGRGHRLHCSDALGHRPDDVAKRRDDLEWLTFRGCEKALWFINEVIRLCLDNGALRIVLPAGNEP